MDKKSDRKALKEYFKKNKVPKEVEFAELIDSVPNIKEDGEIRFGKNGLVLYSKVKESAILELYNEKPENDDEIPCWSFSIGNDKSLLLKNEKGEVVLSISQDKKISVEKLETNEISSVGGTSEVSISNKVKIRDLDADNIVTTNIKSSSSLPIVFSNLEGIKCEKISVDNICHNKNSTGIVSVLSKIKVNDLDAGNIATNNVGSLSSSPIKFSSSEGLECNKIIVDNINEILMKSGMLFNNNERKICNIDNYSGIRGTRVLMKKTFINSFYLCKLRLDSLGDCFPVFEVLVLRNNRFTICTAVCNPANLQLINYLGDDHDDFTLNWFIEEDSISLKVHLNIDEADCRIRRIS